MNDRTIIYCTDNTLDPFLMRKCQEWIVRNAPGVRIVSVSFLPIDFGENIVVGEMPRSGITIDIMIVKALDRIDTKWTLLCEHDCLYCKEHMGWVPPDDRNFFYNDNNWLMQYTNPVYPQYDGMFSYRRRRRVQSQLICGTEIYRAAMNKKVEIVTHPDWIGTFPTGRVAEPGCCDYERTMRITSNPKVTWMRPQIIEYMDRYKCVDFKTKDPNIDIRHGSNFTGHRRGNYRRWELKPWGTMRDIFDA